MCEMVKILLQGKESGFSMGLLYTRICRSPVMAMTYVPAPATTSAHSGGGAAFSFEQAGRTKAKFYQKCGVYPSQHYVKETVISICTLLKPMQFVYVILFPHLM